MSTRTAAIVLSISAIVIALVVLRLPASPTPTASATYYCNGGKTITALYYRGTPAPAPAPGEPPTPTGSVALTLSDGRDMTLAQTISASGIRYANADESFVFWNKGDGALVLENNQEKSYIGCIALAPEPEGANLPQAYANGEAGFSLRLPAGYTPDASYRYEELGPGREISGVKFTVATAVATGTNLGTDSYLSVEQIPRVAPPERECTAALFLNRATARTVTDREMTYSVASTTGAAAGNRYEETVYALPGTNPCIAVRYYIHYGVFENYIPGLVREFDKEALLANFDAIRRTLRIVQ